MTAVMRLTRMLSAVGIGVLLLIGWAAASARADEPSPAVVFDGALTSKGILQASQTITFGEPVSGFEQRLATKIVIDERRYYTYDITNIKAEVDGNEVTPQLSVDGDYQVVTIAESGSSITISYEVSGTTRQDAAADGALAIFEWPVVQGLPVAVESVTGQLRTPAVATLVDCAAGPVGTLEKCQLYAAGTHESPHPSFQNGSLAAGEQMRLTVGLPLSATATTAVVTENWSLDRAFSINLTTVLSALGALLLGGALLWWLFRRTGLDQAHDGELHPVAGFRPTGDGESVFEVTDGIRPGHVGTVADEVVDPVDITATLLDLAVRGQLRITELPRQVHELLDWRIELTGETPDELLEFESELLAVVGEDGILVSQLPGQVAASVSAIQGALYEDVVARGWFESRPDATRNSWRFRGYVGFVIAAAAALALIAFTTFGLLALILLLLGGSLVWVADRMPRRTSAGAKLLTGLEALSALLATHPTDQMPAEAEVEELSKILPFAVVLGGKERWLQAIVATDRDDTEPDPTTVPWYHAPKTWHLQDLPASLTQFIHTVQGELFSR